MRLDRQVVQIIRVRHKGGPHVASVIFQPMIGVLITCLDLIRCWFALTCIIAMKTHRFLTAVVVLSCIVGPVRTVPGVPFTLRDHRLFRDADSLIQSGRSKIPVVSVISISSMPVTAQTSVRIHTASTGGSRRHGSLVAPAAPPEVVPGAVPDGLLNSPIIAPGPIVRIPPAPRPVRGYVTNGVVVAADGPVGVPDGGTTAVALAFALAGMVFIRSAVQNLIPPGPSRSMGRIIPHPHEF